MKVILTERISTLGNVGEMVKVADGFARNYLFPKKLAVIADEKNKKQLENNQKRLAKKVDAEKNDAKAIAAKLNNLTLEFTKWIAGNGKLFGTISANDIANSLEKMEIKVEKRVIIIDTPIKALGQFEIKAKLFKDVEAKFKVKVILDPVQAEEIKKREEQAKLRKKQEALEAKEKENQPAETEAEGTEESAE